jgi:hypothetical protein
LHYLLSLKIKIGIVVVLSAVVIWVAQWLGLHHVGLSAVASIVEGIVIYLLLRSWALLARLPDFALRPAWMRNNLTGDWIGEIRSQWRPSPGAPLLPPIPVTLKLQQGWSEVVFSLVTDKMRSRSFGAVPSYDPITGELRFRYFFETEPTAAANVDNPPQRLGSAIATVQTNQPDSISIRYANERSPGGDIEIRRA